MLYDAYLHCGSTKYEPIENVVSTHERLGVSRGLLVQHFGEFDNRYIIESAESRWPTYRVAVLVDPYTKRWPSELARLAQERVVRGIRVQVDRDHPAWADLVAGASENRLDIVLFLTHGCEEFSEELNACADRYPATKFVLSHLGGSSVKFPETTALALARSNNIFLQASGFSMWPTQTKAQITKALAALVSAYGADRVLWGSNYSKSPIESELRYMLTNPCGLDTADQERIFWRTAVEVWG